MCNRILTSQRKKTREKRLDKSAKLLYTVRTANMKFKNRTKIGHTFLRAMTKLSDMDGGLCRYGADPGFAPA